MFTKKTTVMCAAAAALALSGVSVAEATILVAPGTYNPNLGATTRGTTIRIDQEASFDEATLVSGELGHRTLPSLFENQPDFDTSYGTGNLLGVGSPKWDNWYRGAPIGNADTRTIIEYSYTNGTQVLANQAGGDFAVFEGGNPNEPEMFGIAVTEDGTNYTDYRYEAWDDFRYKANDNSGMLWTIFDLTDFGLGANDSILGIRLINLWLADEVGSATGEGSVTLNGISNGGYALNAGTSDTDYATGSSGYAIFSSGDSDPDIAFVGALALVSVPAPSSLVLFGLALFLGFGGLVLRRTS